MVEGIEPFTSLQSSEGVEGTLLGLIRPIYYPSLGLLVLV